MMRYYLGNYRGGLILAFAASLIIHGLILIVSSSMHQFFSSAHGFGEMNLKLQPQALAVGKVNARQKGSESGDNHAVSHTSIISANALLNDPVIGKIFAAYYKSIREHIYQTSMSQTYSFQGSGNVTLLFVVNRFGFVSSVRVIDSSNSSKNKKISKSILDKASPFLAFPSQINHEAIRFQITLDYS